MGTKTGKHILDFVVNYSGLWHHHLLPRLDEQLQNLICQTCPFSSISPSHWGATGVLYSIPRSHKLKLKMFQFPKKWFILPGPCALICFIIPPVQERCYENLQCSHTWFLLSATSLPRTVLSLLDLLPWLLWSRCNTILQGNIDRCVLVILSMVATNSIVQSTPLSCTCLCNRFVTPWSSPSNSCIEWWILLRLF